MDRGYVKVWRKSLDHPLYKKPLIWHFWGYCLKKASHKKVECFLNGSVIEVEKGSFVFGRKKASEETGLSERQIRTAIKHLEKLQNLTIKTTNKYSIISIINWHTYQEQEKENDQHNDQLPTSYRPATDHIQECKTQKNNNKLPKGSLLKLKVSTPPCPHEEIRKLYNSILPELPTCTVRNKTFDKRTRSRWKEDKKRQNLDWWKNLFLSIKESDFLMGRSKVDFQASLDWIVMPTNMTKILNGNYKNKNCNNKHNKFKGKNYAGTPIEEISWMQN